MKTLREINLDKLTSATKTETITVSSDDFTTPDGVTISTKDFTNEFGNIYSGEMGTFTGTTNTYTVSAPTVSAPTTTYTVSAPTTTITWDGLDISSMPEDLNLEAITTSTLTLLNEDEDLPDEDAGC